MESGPGGLSVAPGKSDPAGASTVGIVSRLSPPESEWITIGRIDLMFSHVDQNMSGLEFPEENFVFSDNFRMILQQAGLADLVDD